MANEREGPGQTENKKRGREDRDGGREREQMRKRDGDRLRQLRRERGKESDRQREREREKKRDEYMPVQMGFLLYLWKRKYATTPLLRPPGFSNKQDRLMS